MIVGLNVQAQTISSAEIKSQIASQLETIYKKNTNADVEVINTKGINGRYTLTQIVQEIEEEKNDEIEQNIEGSQS